MVVQHRRVAAAQDQLFSHRGVAVHAGPVQCRVVKERLRIQERGTSLPVDLAQQEPYDVEVAMAMDYMEDAVRKREEVRTAAGVIAWVCMGLGVPSRSWAFSGSPHARAAKSCLIA